MRPPQLTIDHLPLPRLVLRFEGGNVYLAGKDECFYVILDESTMEFLLDDDDLQGVSLDNIFEFDAEAERVAYLDQRFPGAVFGVEDNDTV